MLIIIKFINRKRENSMLTKIEKLQEEFFRCSECNEIHNEVFVENSCCKDAPIQVFVIKDVAIIIQCAECEKEITRFKFSKK